MEYPHFCQVWILFIKTGGIETTPAIKTLEVHDLTFAFGLYIIYYLTLETQKKKKLYLIPVLICYDWGIKRIGVMGAAAAVAFHMLLCRIERGNTEENNFCSCGKQRWIMFSLCIYHPVRMVQQNCGIFSDGHHGKKRIV